MELLDYGSDSDSVIPDPEIDCTTDTIGQTIVSSPAITKATVEYQYLKCERQFLGKLPPVRTSEEAAENIRQFFPASVNLASILQQNRIFKNPCILASIVEQLGIDQYGTNCSSLKPAAVDLCESAVSSKMAPRSTSACGTESVDCRPNKKSRWDSTS